MLWFPTLGNIYIYQYIYIYISIYIYKYIYIYQTYQLSQLIDEPRRTTSESSTLIDILITNNKETIVHSGVYPLSISDHCLIYAVRKAGISKNKPKFITTRSFKHFNEEKFKTDLIK